MAARPAPSQAATIPDHLSPPDTAARPFPIPDDGAIEVLGRAMKGVAATELSSNGHDISTAGETMRALRLLALDNLIDLVQLRESLTERDAQVSLLEAEVSAWRQRALTEASARKADAAEAYDGSFVAELNGEPIAKFRGIPPFKGFTGNIGAMACYAGQSVGEVRGVQPAAEIVAEVAEQAERLLKGPATANV